MNDPIRVRRRLVAKWAKRAKRTGLLAYLVAIVVFAITYPGGFDGPSVPIIMGLLIGGSVLLLPATVIGYGANAAERDDRQLGV